MNLTILTPTRNRFDYVKKLLLYYQKFDFKGKILILDSSQNKIFTKTKFFLKKNQNVNVQHYKIDGRPFECIKYIIPKIKTEFVCFSGDDDYYIINGLEKSIKILKNNKQIHSVNGLSIVSNLKKKSLFSIEYLLYNHFYSTDNKSVLRLIKILQDYKVPLFSIFRLNIFRKVLSKVPSKSKRYLCPTRIIHDEILESLLFVYFNKIYNFKFPFIIRTIPKKKYAKSSMDNLFM